MHALQTPVQAAQWLRGAVTGQLHSDSRKVQQGDGFLAWPGSAHDARAYVAAALAQGASACLVEAEGFQDYPWPTSIDKQKIGIYEGLKQASGPIADAYYESPSQQLQMLAVTGTNGKTSTAWWLAHALTRLGKRMRHGGYFRYG
jgi:UDP-N-acetylmuramoyl-L-alanyl-D-glutamate--2,6-diaminopimelate ligase